MLAGMAIFRVQRTDEPASAAEYYEIGSPNWKPAVHAFAVGRKLTAPVMVDVKRWDAASKTTWEDTIKTHIDQQAGEPEAYRVPCPGK